VKWEQFGRTVVSRQSKVVALKGDAGNRETLSRGQVLYEESLLRTLSPYQLYGGFSQGFSGIPSAM
jgi:hypothetical protein